jgi:hypothetical protein
MAVAVAVAVIHWQREARDGAQRRQEEAGVVPSR